MQFSAGIVILCEDFRYSHIIRELPGTMHTPEIASAFQPPAGAVSFKDVCWKKGGKSNIRKEPVTCRNFRTVHWLCVKRLALNIFFKFSNTFIDKSVSA